VAEENGTGSTLVWSCDIHASPQHPTVLQRFAADGVLNFDSVGRRCLPARLIGSGEKEHLSSTPPRPDHLHPDTSPEWYGARAYAFRINSRAVDKPGSWAVFASIGAKSPTHSSTNEIKASCRKVGFSDKCISVLSWR
jgi:hypothetical protein